MILARDAEAWIGRIVSSLAPVVDEVMVVVDTSTTDGTAEAAQSAGARVCHRTWMGFGPMRNWAQAQARNEWIFMVDSDEVPDADLLDAIARSSWDDPRRVFVVDRLNYYIGRPLRCCGLSPDLKPRIYHRSIGRWSTHHVHERLEVAGPVRYVRLAGRLHHYFIDSVDEHLDKARRYAALRARDWLEKGRRYSAAAALGHAMRKFTTLYVLRGGWRAGWRGLAYSSITAMDRLLRHIYLARYLESSASNGK